MDAHDTWVVLILHLYKHLILFLKIFINLFALN